DYTGSEITTTHAIKLLNPLQKYQQLYSCYNNLGIIYKELGDYDKALNYHEQALDYLRRSSRKNALEPITLNNIGVVYKNQGNYKEAVAKYEEARRKNNLYAKDPEWEATFKDNIAYARFKMDNTKALPEMFLEALQMRDSLNDVPGMVTSNLHLSEYYKTYQDTATALKYARKAYGLAASSGNSGDLLTSLRELSQLENSEKSAAYLNDYIKISDSLQRVERRLRDKFARIRFESAELELKNEELKQWLKISRTAAFAVLAFSGLLFIIILQQNRNRRLSLERMRQRVNEEIYNLLLNQQNKVDEGRRQERKRISEELHDGVLGKLFGARLLLSGLNTKSDKKSIEARTKHIEELQEIETEIRGVSHELNAEKIINKAGFITLVVNVLETHSKIGKFTFSKKGDDTIDWETVSGKIKANLYRIIQEAIQNINKYAKAKNVDIEFKKENNMLSVIIVDDGVGFDVKKKKSGIGIKNMGSRVAGFNGKLVVESFRNKGTKIKIIVPLN
ncbi:MAG: tetratricopeptide repeat protein, partial [Sinomicrobium sp.]|nr:tetratricopeptide repeat protein [Sinomicrobium sp.]